MSAGGSKLRWCELRFDNLFSLSHAAFTDLDPMGGMIVCQAFYLLPGHIYHQLRDRFDLDRAWGHRGLVTDNVFPIRAARGKISTA